MNLVGLSVRRGSSSDLPRAPGSRRIQYLRPTTNTQKASDGSGSSWADAAARNAPAVWFAMRPELPCLESGGGWQCPRASVSPAARLIKRPVVPESVGAGHVVEVATDRIQLQDIVAGPSSKVNRHGSNTWPEKSRNRVVRLAHVCVAGQCAEIPRIRTGR